MSYPTHRADRTRYARRNTHRCAPAIMRSALVAILATACASAAPRPDPATAPLPDRHGPALAGWMEEVCEGNGQERVACLEALTVRIAEGRGIAAAMDAVAHLQVSDGQGHALTHMIGIRGYRGAEAVGDSFAECTAVYQSGCYHGVIQAYFADLSRRAGPGGLTTDRLDAVCTPYADTPEDRWRHFQCLHGLGHGVMLVHDNHLPHALEACDLLSRPWDRQVCYGGAFMEHAMALVAPHHDHVGPAVAAPGEAHDAHAHHPADPPTHHDHAAHAGHDHAASEPFPLVDPEDLHYPCSVLAPHYRWACYDLQTSIMLHLLDRDIAATAAACRDAPDPELRALCHRSLGRDINAETDGRHAESAALCALADPADRPSCHEGVVRNVMDVAADAEAGVAYCVLLPEGPESRACYHAIGEQTLMLIANPAERPRVCQAVDERHRQICLDAAGAGAPARTGGAER